MNASQNINIEDIIGEKWARINGFPNYMISNLGRVKSITRVVNSKHGSKKTTVGRVLMQLTNLRGYKFVTIYDDMANPKMKLISRLVAEHFIENPENKPQVNHKNGIKHDNSVNNLEWHTSSENQRHAVRTGLRVQPSGTNHYKNKKVKNILTGIIHSGIKEAASSEGFTYSAMKSKIRSKYSIYEYV